MKEIKDLKEMLDLNNIENEFSNFQNGHTISIKLKMFDAITFAQHEGTHNDLEMLIWDKDGNSTTKIAETIFERSLDGIIKMIKLLK